MKRIRVANGSTVTLGASIAAKSLIGHNWTLALGGQSIAGAYVEGATISGVSSGAGPVFVDCHFTGTQTVGSGDYYRCGFGITTFTMIASSLYNFVNCFDDDPDTTTSPIFVFAASAVVGARNWRGAFQVSSMASTNKLTIDGAGRLIITDTSVGGAITVRGFYPPVAGGAGLHTVAEFVAHGGTFTQTTRYDTDQINAQVDDALNTAIPGSPTADSINQRIAAIDDLTQASGAGDLAAIKGYVDDIGIAGAGLTALGDTRLANLDAAVSTRSAPGTAQTITANQAVNVAQWGGANIVTPAVTGSPVVTLGATQAAYAPAKAGDQMDLVNAPNGTAVTAIQSGLATPTNITAGTITTVTNLTNAPTVGDLTTTMKSSVNAEVVDALNVDTYAEPTGAPAATASLAAKIGRQYQALRNKLTVTSSAKTLHDDAGAALWAKALSDDGTTYTEDEGA